MNEMLYICIGQFKVTVSIRYDRSEQSHGGSNFIKLYGTV